MSYSIYKHYKIYKIPCYDSNEHLEYYWVLERSKSLAYNVAVQMILYMGVPFVPDLPSSILECRRAVIPKDCMSLAQYFKNVTGVDFYILQRMEIDLK